MEKSRNMHVCIIICIRYRCITYSCTPGMCSTVTFRPYLPATLLYLPPLFPRRSLMLTAWPGTPSVRTCCASQATATLTSRPATFLYISRRCKALWSATTALRSSVSMSIPCLLWRCLRCVVWCQLVLVWRQ